MIRILTMIVFASLTLAQTPVPPDHPVRQLEQEKQKTLEKEKALKAELNSIKSDLTTKQKEIVTVAARIKENENSLLALESQISQQESAQQKLQDNLTRNKAELSRLILAMNRLKSIPPEALLARPSAPYETAQSSMVLNTILPQLYTKAQKVESDITQLAVIVSDLKVKREKALNTSKTLEENHQALARFMEERKGLYAKTERDFQSQQKELKRIADEAKNLKELVAKIEQRQKDIEQQQKQKSMQQASLNNDIRPRAAAIPTPLPKAGEPQLPISGLIQIGFGKTDDIGAVSQGLKIKGRSNGLVVAPMGGVVDYAGPFKGYGNIVILQHQGDYHSLIAGLESITTQVGRSLSSGEPLGTLSKKSADNDAPILYYELRYRGKPVNPAKKIKGLR